MHILKLALRNAFRSLGGLRLARYVNRRSLRIIMYHRFPDASSSIEGLEQQCRHYRQYYSPINMTEAVSALREHRALPENTLVVTVDDGHRDFYDVAWPIFKAYSIPVIIYLVTDFVDQVTWLWPDCIEYAVQSTNKALLQLPVDGSRNACLPLKSAADRAVAIQVIKTEAKRRTHRDRIALVQDLLNLLNVSLTERPASDYCALSWDDVRELATAGVEFGVHTKSHPLLSKVDDEELEPQILTAQRHIESELNRPVRHFCYPSGDFDDRSEKIVRDNFDSAVTTVRGINALDKVDRFRLQRVGADPESNYSMFEQYLTGFRLREASFQ